MIKRLVIAVLLLGLIVGGIVGFNMFRDNIIENVFANMQPPPVGVAVIEAEPITWQPSIEAIGTANAAQGVELAVEVGGVVESIRFQANQRVEAGEVLLHIRDEIEVADLAAAEASLQLAQTELSRVSELQTRGVGTATAVDTAQAQATNARSQVARLTAILEQKALRAPFAGVTGIPQVDVGEYIQPGTVIATLQDLDTMRVDFSIPEQQVTEISIGQPITVSAQADSRSFVGNITGIEPKIDPGSRLVTIRGSVDNPDGALNPGQFLRVRIELPAESGVIALPQTVLSSNLYGDSVFIVREGDGGQGEAPEPAPAGEDVAEAAGDGAAAAESAAGGDAEAGPDLTVEQVFVKVGRRSQGLVEIVEGVESGDRVVTAGQNRLSGGARVVIDDLPSPVSAPAAG